MSTSCRGRRVFGQSSEDAAIPRGAECRRERIRLSLAYPEHRGKLRLDDEEPLIVDSGIGEHLLRVDDPPLFLDLDRLVDGIADGPDESLAGDEPGLDVVKSPVLVNGLEYLPNPSLAGSLPPSCRVTH